MESILPGWQRSEAVRPVPVSNACYWIDHDIYTGSEPGERADAIGNRAKPMPGRSLDCTAANRPVATTDVEHHVAVQGVASDKEHVLAALAKAAQRMRAKLGEPLTSIQTLSPPELHVTTESLEAFQAFTTGQQLFMQTRFADAIPFLQQATQLYANLAMAYKFLASAALNTGGGYDPRVVQDYSDKAYALRDRVSAYEKFWIDYSRDVPDAGLENLELWSRTYPGDPAPVVFAALIHSQLASSKKP